MILSEAKKQAYHFRTCNFRHCLCKVNMFGSWGGSMGVMNKSFVDLVEEIS